MKNNYEIVIVGAGPAGLSTALNLLNYGINDILVIEKDTFPRYKCCAGYITKATRKEYEKLGLNFRNINYSLISDFNIFYKYKLKQRIINKFLYTNDKIDRVELDNAFYELAKSKNIKILEKTTIKENNLKGNFIILSSKKKIYYNKLIFADGFNSFGNKYQPLKKNKNIAMQLIFESTKQNENQIHFGITKNGYGWVSSYNGITNVGFTDLYNSQINYKKTFASFLQKLDLELSLKDLKGAFTPIGIKRPIIDSMFYVGDAVGACDPLTLSGVKYALKSGFYCAKSIAMQKPHIYLKFISKIKIKFYFMKILSKIFYLKAILFCIFEIGCRFFSNLISYVFNHFFVNKK